MDAQAQSAKRVAVVGLLGTLIVLACKLALWRVTDSAAVLADALESLANIGASMMALFAVWYAARPPDREHPYGHGNIEFIAVGIEGVLIVLAGIAIAVQSIVRLIHGGEVAAIDIGVIGMAGIAVWLIALGGYLVRSGRRLESAALVADGKHLLVDAGSTLGVMLALIVVRFTGWHWLDPVAAVAICVIAMTVGARLIWRAVHRLLDHIDEDDLAAINAILAEEVADGRIVSFEKVRLRHHGADHWVEMHLRFPPQTPVATAHAVASAIEHRIEQQFKRCNATAHIEPAI